MAELDFKLITESAVDLDEFDCGVESINQYVKESYFPSLAQHAYAYTVSAKGKTLGYIQFLFRDVSLCDFPDDIADIDSGVKDETLSAVHIRYMAIDEKYQGRKIGTAVLNIAIGKIEELAKKWPISMITIDARIDLVSWYEKEGFKHMIKNKSGQEGYTQAMYYNCIRDYKRLQEYCEEFW